MTRCAECICRDVALAFGVTVGELRLPDRRRPVAYARFAAFRLMREEAHLSMPQIGRILGHRDHSTVHYGLDAASRLLTSDAEFASRYEEARAA